MQKLPSTIKHQHLYLPSAYQQDQVAPVLEKSFPQREEDVELLLGLRHELDLIDREREAVERIRLIAITKLQSSTRRVSKNTASAPITDLHRMSVHRSVLVRCDVRLEELEREKEALMSSEGSAGMKRQLMDSFFQAIMY